MASTISLCKRAGKLTTGFDMVVQAVKKGQAKLVLTASDLSERTRKEIIFVCTPGSIPVHAVRYTLNELWYLTGKKAAILAVTDDGLAKKLLGLLQRENREEPNL